MTETITKRVFEDRIVYINEKNDYHNINDEPAIIFTDGTKYWYRNGKFHRTKGPALIYSDRKEYWFYEGCPITDKVNQLITDGKIDPDWSNWSEEDEFLFVLLVS